MKEPKKVFAWWSASGLLLTLAACQPAVVVTPGWRLFESNSEATAAVPPAQ